ncbi:endonuclease V [Actinomadura sp. ATCC 31491]|uniref:Endonuclease V n=1 Tax=Actinomadura luzonensis TaxID=2805427 RepID=A0ABT0FX30_9ACTN|nr:endonuclease V [Actinomadura luzonensis]MCK2216824.1 endonuclease V [Actinomadura luzonensis]
MQIPQLEPWPDTAEEAEAVQDRLRPRVELSGPTSFALVAGLDVHYHGTGSGGEELTAAVVVLDAATLDVVEQVAVRGKAAFPYVPGLFAFRELPALAEALGRLTVTPDLLVCDGYGLAHPRGFGLACHVGVLTGLPALGVGKTPFVGAHEPPAPERGAWTPIVHDGAVVGRALRTQRGVKPVYVSQGHRVSLDTVTEQVLRLSPRYRLPEPVRRADHLARHPVP